MFWCVHRDNNSRMFVGCFCAMTVPPFRAVRRDSSPSLLSTCSRCCTDCWSATTTCARAWRTGSATLSKRMSSYARYAQHVYLLAVALYTAVFRSVSSMMLSCFALCVLQILQAYVLVSFARWRSCVLSTFLHVCAWLWLWLWFERMRSWPPLPHPGGYSLRQS